MLLENDRFRDFLGVTAWHKAGYAGKRGLTLTGENPNIEKPHAAYTKAVFREIAPDREIIYLGRETDTFVLGDTFQAVMEQAFERKADTMYMSYEGGGNNWDEYSELLMPFCSIFNAAGNDGDDEYIPRIACKKHLRRWGISAHVPRQLGCTRLLFQRIRTC